MKFYPRLGIYKASNVSFSLAKMDARSYGWWQFVAKVGSKVIFNTHAYSNTTRRHQHKVQNMLDNLGITVDIYVDTRSSLSESSWINVAIKELCTQIESLKVEIAKPRTHAAKNEERRELIVKYEQDIHKLVLLAMEVDSYQGAA